MKLDCNEPPLIPGKNLLIADDDKGIFDLLDEILRNEGYSVFSAFNGQKALDIAKAHHLSIAVLDINMPVMGG